MFLHPEEVSLAIGKGGLNIRLATMLTGYTIDVYRDIEEGEEDIYLDEFRDEIDGWVIEQLKMWDWAQPRQCSMPLRRNSNRQTLKTTPFSRCLTSYGQSSKTDRIRQPQSS